MPLTLAETPLYYKDSQGQYHRVLSGADMTGYRTAAAQDAIDAAQDEQIAASAKAGEVGIVITGKRPSVAVTAGQYVIVRGSTISGITDGLYTANAELSPSTDVTAANLTAVSGGGLNDIHDILNIHTFGAADITELRSGISFYNNNARGYVIGSLCVFNCVINSSGADIPAYTNLFRLPYHPSGGESNFFIMNSTSFPSAIGFIGSSGYVQFRAAIPKNNYIPIFTVVFTI